MQMPYSMNQVPSTEHVYELVKSLKMQKALQTGDYNRFGNEPGNASALKPESLDTGLVNTSYSMRDIQLFRLLNRNPVVNSINQYNELVDYTDNPDASFFPEGGAPPQDSSTLLRRLNQIKYMGVARGITHQLSLQRVIDQDALTYETQLGTMDLLGKIERSLWHADSSLSVLQFDGLIAQIKAKAPALNVIDMHGAPLTEDALVDGATFIRSAPNFGAITHIFSSIGIKGDIARAFIPRSRILPMATDNTGKIGTNIRAIETPAGDIDLVGCTMMTDSVVMPLSATGPAISIPGTPTVANVKTTAVGYSNYRDSDAGAYFAWVVAKNDTGASAPVPLSNGPINIPAGGSLTFDFTPAPGNPTKWIEVWKTPVNAPIGTQRRVFRAPNTDPVTTIANTQTKTFVEFNETMAGTEFAIGLQMEKEAISLDVLAGMLRLPQPIQGTTLPFLLVSYLALVLKAPRKTLMFKNVGRLPRQQVIV